MWSSTPSCVPNEWRRKGAEELADAIGYGTKLGPGPVRRRPIEMPSFGTMVMTR